MKTARSTSPVALVTGAGRRLGRDIALSLAASGYDVVINYNKSKKGAEETVKQIRKIGRKAISIKADVSKKDQVQKMVQQAIKYFGKIDVLVNNAAIFVNGTLLDTTEKLWDDIFSINLKSLFLCSQAIAPYMLKQKKGKIINMASLGGIQAWPKHLPYSVTKAGVIMLTKCMAKTLAPTISVNAIAPGTIIIEGEEDPSVKHVSKDSVPLKKYGKSSDITDAIIYLATKAEYITGQVIVIDGGRSIQ